MRMGRDKALLTVSGVPLWWRQRDVLAGAGAAEIFLSARPEHEWAYGAPGFNAVLHDALPDCGPIIGVTAAVERASHGHIAAVAVDLPRMTAAWFLRLLATCKPGVGAVGRSGNFYEPLAAIYPREMKWLLWETIASGNYSFQTMLAEAEKAGLVRVLEIAAEEAPLFANWNESDALAPSNP